MDWLQIGQTLGVPLLILAALYVFVSKVMGWAKPHADNNMADIRANSAATRQLIATLEATQANMTHQLGQIGNCQEMLARSDQRTSRALTRLVNVLEDRPCVGIGGMKTVADSDDFSDVDKEDSKADA